RSAHSVHHSAQSPLAIIRNPRELLGHRRVMAKVLQWLQVLVIGATFVHPAMAQLPETASPRSGTNTNQSSARDRRDSLFYPSDTKRPKPLLRKLFPNIALDQKDIFTSPFHANRENALQWLLPLATTGALIAADTHIADAFENSKGQIRWGSRISNIGASYTL